MKKTASSKSLFRATKAKPDRGAALSMLMPRQDAPKNERRDDDFYPTGQPEAIRALLAYDGERIGQCGSVWEPACGDGAMVKEIRRMGLRCHATDLVDRECPDSSVSSFYTHHTALAPAVITNPPYNEINARDGHGRWLRHTLDLKDCEYFALLLSWEWPAARANGLGAMLDRHPFSYCYLMRWKLDFTGEGSPPQRNAWFVWDRTWTGEPAFRWMDRTDCRQEALI